MARADVALTIQLGVLTAVHDMDHLRQGRLLPWPLYFLGAAAMASIAFTLFVLLRRPRWARPVAVAQGVLTVVGVGVVHGLPQWSWFSDSYTAAHADILSWAIIVGMMGLGATLAVVAAWRRA